MFDRPDVAATSAFSSSAVDTLTVEAVLSSSAIRCDGASCFGFGLADAIDAIETVGALCGALTALWGCACACTNAKALAIGVTGLAAIFPIGANATLAHARNAALGIVAYTRFKARTIGFTRNGFYTVGADTGRCLVGFARSRTCASTGAKAFAIGTTGLVSVFPIGADTSPAFVGCAGLGTCAYTSIKARTIGLTGLTTIFSVGTNTTLGCARCTGFFGQALLVLADVISGAIGVLDATRGRGFASAIVATLTLRTIGVLGASCRFVFADTAITELASGTIAVLSATRGSVASPTDAAFTRFAVRIAIARSRAQFARSVVADLAQIALAVLGADRDDIALAVDTFLLAWAIAVLGAGRAFADKAGGKALGVKTRTVAAIARRTKPVRIAKLDAEIARPYEVTRHPRTAILDAITGLTGVG